MLLPQDLDRLVTSFNRMDDESLERQKPIEKHAEVIVILNKKHLGAAPICSYIRHSSFYHRLAGLFKNLLLRDSVGHSAHPRSENDSENPTK
jgi:hypothetical protein